MIGEVLKHRIQSFWATELSAPLSALQISGVTVLSRADERGAFILHMGSSSIWQVPAKYTEPLGDFFAASHAPSILPSEEVIAACFGDAVALVLGPCPLAYFADTAIEVNPNWPSCRQLTVSDMPAIIALARECGEEAWEHGGINLKEHPAVFGSFAGNTLLAAASYEIWGNDIAHVGVVTDPAYRRRNLAKAVAAAATGHALAQNLLPQWRTLASNTPSVAVGKALGYELIATHYFVRLRVDP